MSEFQKMKNWMRSQQCVSAGLERRPDVSGLDLDSQMEIDDG